MNWFTQVIIIFLAGFFAGYLYRCYQLKFQLMDKGKFEDLLEGYGFIGRKENIIELVIKAMIVVLIALAIYGSVYGN